MNDSVQVEYNSEYELIGVEKGKNDDHMSQAVSLDGTVSQNLFASAKFVMFVLTTVVLMTFALIGLSTLGYNISNVPQYVYGVTILYTLWRSRLLTNWIERIVWTLFILTGIGAIIFLILDPVANRDRNIVKQKRIMG